MEDRNGAGQLGREWRKSLQVWMTAKRLRGESFDDVPQLVKKLLSAEHAEAGDAARSRWLCAAYREDARVRLVVGRICDIVVSLCVFLRLDVFTTSTALLFVHHYLKAFTLRHVQKKVLASAAVLLAWKIYEDRGAPKCSRKLWEIPKALYCIVESRMWEGRADGDSVQDWMMRGSGRIFNSLCDRIKACESCLLRTLRFRTLALPLPYCATDALVKGMVAALAHELRLAPDALSDLEALLRCQAFLLLLDCMRTPFALVFSARELALGAVWKASVRCGVPALCRDGYEGAMENWFRAAAVTDRGIITHRTVADCLDVWRTWISSDWRQDPFDSERPSPPAPERAPAPQLS